MQRGCKNIPAVLNCFQFSDKLCALCDKEHMKNRMTRAHSIRKLLVVDETEEEIDLDMNDYIDDADFEDAIDVPGSTNTIEAAVLFMNKMSPQTSHRIHKKLLLQT